MLNQHLEDALAYAQVHSKTKELKWRYSSQGEIITDTKYGVHCPITVITLESLAHCRACLASMGVDREGQDLYLGAQVSTQSPGHIKLRARLIEMFQPMDDGKYPGAWWRKFHV